MASSNDRTLVYREESTWGTAVTITLNAASAGAIPFKADGDGLAATFGRLDSDAVYAGSYVESSNSWAPGDQRVTGTLKTELYDRAIVTWFKHAFGAVSSTTASSPYTHTFTPASLTGKGLTVQVGRPGSDGTVYPFTYAGVKIAKWNVHAEIGQIATASWECVAKSQTTGTSLVTVTAGSYTSGIKAFTYVGGSCTIAGATSGVNVRAFDVNGDNMLNVERAFIDGGAVIVEPLEQAPHVYSGSLALEFANLTHYNTYANAAEVAVVLALARSTSSLTFTLNARFDGATPVLSGTWPQIVDVPFKAVRSGNADSTAISVAFVSPDATP